MMLSLNADHSGHGGYGERHELENVPLNSATTKSDGRFQKPSLHLLSRKKVSVFIWPVRSLGRPRLRQSLEPLWRAHKKRKHTEKSARSFFQQNLLLSTAEILASIILPG